MVTLLTIKSFNICILCFYKTQHSIRNLREIEVWNVGFCSFLIDRKGGFMTNENTKEFIKILSRYVEVSHVYFLTIQKEKDFFMDSSHKDRHTRLLELLEKLAIPKTQNGIAQMDEKDVGGQSVVPTQENFAQTAIYQDIVKDFLAGNFYNQTELRNKTKILKLLNATPQEFLGSFSTVSYAWDILTELACLSFLPSAEKLSSRDLIHMHCVELIEHLSRLYVQTIRMNPNNAIDLNGRFTVRELENFQCENDLVEKILGSSSKKNVSELVVDLCGLFENEDKIKRIIDPLVEPVLSRLVQVENGFPDLLEEDISMLEVERICNQLVSFGISMGYAIWLTYAKTEKIHRGMLLKHCLFCTRYLLDEKRWMVCKNISSLCKEIVYITNNLEGEQNKHKGAYMVEANYFFAKKMLGENIVSEVQSWDLSRAHSRYKLLQRILLDMLDNDTVVLSKELLQPEANGKPNMSIHEFVEWPILEPFRKSSFWSEFKNYAQELHNV